MRTLHLFAGAGGGLLADLILGHTPVCAVEWDPYCCEVLRERRDEGWFPGLEVWEGDVRQFPAEAWAGRVDCLHAGWPCVDITRIGRRAGLAGDSSGLWSEVVRVAGDLRPRFLLLENSRDIVRRGLHAVLADLARLGLDARWTVMGASSVGAPHRRERWWALAYPTGQRLEGVERARSAQGPVIGGGWWHTPPGAVRVANGDAAWLDRIARIRAVGNAQVPLTAAAAWVMLGGPWSGA